VGLAALAACGSSGPYVASAGSGAKAANTSAATVSTHIGPLGTYLADSKGRTLYEFANDTSSTSTCSGSCATYWPPVTSTGAPVAGAGVTSGMLGTTMRADGTTQVTYSGHPLYLYAGDAKAGDTKGQGLNASGGLWWLLSPAGARITGKAGTPSSPAGGSGYGYG
jgi:predicted lipoprotein with Yx(FWY)xxD motif